VTPEDLARRVRRHAVRMCAAANASHVGTSLSVADVLAVLYAGVLRHDPARPDWPDRDRLIFSKGHGAAALYAVLAESGYFAPERLADYCADGSALTGHVSHAVPGVEFSTGSLGHGLPVGCGLALAAKRGGRPWRTFVVLSDGELDEGSNWEAALFAAHHRLDNLVAVLDYNKIQSYGRVADVLGLEPLAAKWQAFGWAAREIDGHDAAALGGLLVGVPFEPGRPGVAIAHTVKGKGVSFMEDDLAWHYRSPRGELLQRALDELAAP
jgi:transketolase